MNIFKSYTNILIIAPHTDDLELGMGGTVSKLIQNNVIIDVIVLSSADTSLKSNFTPGTTLKECKDAGLKLGIEENKIKIFDYPVRLFSNYRQDILDQLVKFSKDKLFDCVFIPSRNDIHQDHQVTTQEAIRAFKNVSLIGYELVWNQFIQKCDMFVQLNDKHIDAKIKSIESYKSQTHRPYCHPNFIKSMAIMRGTQVGVKYAECFEIIRLIDL